MGNAYRSSSQHVLYPLVVDISWSDMCSVCSTLSTAAAVSAYASPSPTSIPTSSASPTAYVPTAGTISTATRRVLSSTSLWCSAWVRSTDVHGLEWNDWWFYQS